MNQHFIRQSLVGLLLLTAPMARLWAYNLLEKTDLSGQVKIGGDYVDNKQVEARVFGVSTYLNIKTQFNEKLKFDFSGGAAADVGSNNSFIIDEYAPRRQVQLKRAFFQWNPYESLGLKVGAINQRDYNLPLLLTRTAFLGSQQQFNINFSPNHKLYLRLQQAIPNNLNLTQRIGIVEDGTPSFFIETIGLKLDGDLLAFEGSASRWSYDALSTGVAYQSQFLGNSVSGGGQLNSDFIYRYSGYTANAYLKISLSDDFGIKTWGHYLYNDEAPEKRNRGQLFAAGLFFGHLLFHINYFKNESDSSPAFYNSALFSHNNHEGSLVQITYENPHTNNENEVTAYINYVESSPITFNAFQSDTKKVNFGVNLPFDL